MSSLQQRPAAETLYRGPGSHHLHLVVLQQQGALRSLGVMTAAAAAAARGHRRCRPLYNSLQPVCVENHVMQPQQAALARQSPLTGDTVQRCVIPRCLLQQHNVKATSGSLQASLCT